MIAPRNSGRTPGSLTVTLGVNVTRSEAAAIRAWSNSKGTSISQTVSKYLRDKRFAAQLMEWHSTILNN